MFGAIKAGRFDQFAPRFLLEPPEGPWIVVFDDFLSDTECEHLLSASTGGGRGGFRRSTDQGGYNEFGEQEQITSSTRTFFDNASRRSTFSCADHDARGLH